MDLFIYCINTTSPKENSKKLILTLDIQCAGKQYDGGKYLQWVPLQLLTNGLNDHSQSKALSILLDPDFHQHLGKFFFI